MICHVTKKQNVELMIKKAAWLYGNEIAFLGAIAITDVAEFEEDGVIHFQHLECCKEANYKIYTAHKPNGDIKTDDQGRQLFISVIAVKSLFSSN